MWAVIDFDLAKMANPSFALAMLNVAYRFDVPFIEKVVGYYGAFIRPILIEVIEAYLSGYEDKSQKTMDRRRLLWYRVRFEIYYLSLMIKKDRFHSSVFQYGIGLLQQLCNDMKDTR